jgi:hypothetical protein
MADTALHLLGVDLDNVYTSAGELPHAQGVEVVTQNGRAILARAASGVAQFSLVVLAPSSANASASTVALLGSTGNATQGRLAIAQTSVTSAGYGWFHTEINRDGKVLALDACLPNVRLYTTATGGAVDDATVSAGPIQGLFIKATASGTTAIPCVANNMVIVQNAAIN